MDYALPEELQMVKAQARKFVEEEIQPRWQEIDRTHQIPESVVRKMRGLGYFGVLIPEEHGGMGLGTFGYCLILEELARGHGAFIELISGNNSLASRGIVLDGTDDQKKKYLPKIAQGEFLAAFALTEPGAGSDAQAITTRAEKKNGQYVLNGIKHFITRADVADVTMVMAVTDREKRGMGGITAFLVDKGTPGMKIGQIQESIADDLVHQCEVVFEDCRVPESNVVGAEGFGFMTALKVLDDGRLTLAAVCLGAAERLLALSLAYAKERHTFGKPLSSRQLIQAMLADSATEIYATRSMLYETAWKRDQGERVTRESSMVKLFASEMVNRVADRAFQIYGGAAYMKESPIGRAYASVRVLRIVEGASEIQRMIIAKDMMKE